MTRFDSSAWKKSPWRPNGVQSGFTGAAKAHFRLQTGQRFHRTDFPAVIWRVVTVYRDQQGLEHATLEDEGRRLDEKTLSAYALFDRSQYRLI